MGQLDHSGSAFTHVVENWRTADANPGAGNGLGSMLEGMQKTINQAVENHIKNGDYVKPAGQPRSLDDRATTLARETEHAGMMGGNNRGIFAGMTPRDDGMTYYGPGMTQYAEKTREACRDIEKQEEGLARKRWDSLSPAEQKEIDREKSARDAYEMQMVYRTNYAPPATPHLDAFTRAVKQDIAPLEAERQERQHEVWKGLPVETKASIFRAQEEAKHFKAL